jgi:hypothetical protein
LYVTFHNQLIDGFGWKLLSRLLGNVSHFVRKLASTGGSDCKP